MTNAGFYVGRRGTESCLSREHFLQRSMLELRETWELPEEWRLDEVAVLRLVLSVPGKTDFPGQGRLTITFHEDLTVQSLEAQLHPEHMDALFLADPTFAEWGDERLMFWYDGEETVNSVIVWIRGALGHCWSSEDLFCAPDGVRAEPALV